MRLTNWFYTVPLRLRSLFRRSLIERELDEELRYHFDRQIEELIAKGMTPEEARYAALRAMDGLTLNLVVRTESEPRSVIAAIRHEFGRLNPILPVFNVKTMVEHMNLPLFPARVAAAMHRIDPRLADALAI